MKLPLIPEAWRPDYYKVSRWASIFTAVVTVYFIAFQGIWWGFDLRHYMEARLGFGPATALYIIAWAPPWGAMMVLQVIMLRWSSVKFAANLRELETMRDRYVVLNQLREDGFDITRIVFDEHDRPTPMPKPPKPH